MPEARNSGSTTGSDSPPVAFESVAIVKAPVALQEVYGTTEGPQPENGAGFAESPVMRSLRWLKKEQNKDGSWNTGEDPKTVSTALGILAFLGHGESPASEEFGDTVEQAIRYLLALQKADGSFVSAAKETGIEHGIISWALCETYGMTRIPITGDASKKAINVILTAQLSSGLWSSDYSTNGVQDIEVSVWQIQALKAARLAGVEAARVKATMEKTVEPLKESITAAENKRTIAPATLCLQLTGHSNDAVCKQALRDLADIAVEWDKPEVPDPVYHWYFMHQARYYDGGQSWRDWNGKFIPQLVKAQRIVTAAIPDRRGRMRDVGYWISPSNHERYGKIYSTALWCPLLGYRRCLPTFKHASEDENTEQDQEPAEDDIKIEIQI